MHAPNSKIHHLEIRLPETRRGETYLPAALEGRDAFAPGPGGERHVCPRPRRGETCDVSNQVSADFVEIRKASLLGFAFAPDPGGERRQMRVLTFC